MIHSSEHAQVRVDKFELSGGIFRKCVQAFFEFGRDNIIGEGHNE